MAGLAHYSKNFFLGSLSKIGTYQAIRTHIYYKQYQSAKEYHDADKFEDGTTVQATLHAMAARGFCRPTRPYTPPEDLQERLMGLFKKHLPGKDLSKLREVRLEQPIKVQLLADCVREFDHDIPNYELAELTTLKAVANFFSTRVDGLNPYEKLLADADKLPENLHVIPDGVRFHPDTDTMFKGVTAFPGSGTQVSGLRSRKKYASWKMDRQWPYEIHTSRLK